MVPVINFSINSLQGLDGCKRIALDDNLAIALVFNTDKQMYMYKFRNDLCLVLRKSGTMNEKSGENE